MKASGVVGLSILVVLCFGLLWAFHSPAKNAPVAQSQQLTGNENHQIDLATALRFIKNNKANPKVPSIKGGFFGRNAFDKILAQPGCIGVRYYYAQMDDGSPTLVLVGVDDKGQDIEAGPIMERTFPCPPYCWGNSELAR